MADTMIKNVQYVGADIGRGYVKGYSEFQGQKYSCLFKSVISLGRDLDFSTIETKANKDNYEPIFIEVENEEYFVGMLAEKEGDSVIQNLKDDKTARTVQILLYALLNEIAISDTVKVMLGVPKKLFKKSVVDKVIATYKGKKIKIKNKLTGSYKVVTILDINIFREADAALLWHVSQNEWLKKKAVAIANVGFRTTELSYYDEGLVFNDKFSKTIEVGNKTALEYVQRQLEKKEIMRPLAEIDSSDKYNKYKKSAYSMLSEKIETEIESSWINLSEVEVFIAGGTAKKLEIEYELIEDPQMATSKGLFWIATKKFCM